MDPCNANSCVTSDDSKSNAVNNQLQLIRLLDYRGDACVHDATSDKVHSIYALQQYYTHICPIR